MTIKNQVQTISLVKKVHSFFYSLQFVYWISFLIIPTLTYFIGKKNAIKIQNPDIIIDTSEVNCQEELDVSENNSNTSTQQTSQKTQTLNRSKNNPSPLTNKQATTSNNNFLSSKSSKKYYPIDCPAKNRIKEENRIYYATEEEAQKAGKELSNECQ